MRNIVSVIISVFSLSLVQAQNMIPNVAQYNAADGYFTISSNTAILCGEKSSQAARYLGEYIPVNGSHEAGGAVEFKDDASLSAESYRLLVQENSIRIYASSESGFFYGVQTLLALLPESVYSRTLTLPVRLGCCSIEDSPQMSYRGFMLDVARTFVPKREVMRILDAMAHMKLNKLHFHLTDDEGWRIEIKSHPELAQVGGFRGGDSPVSPRYGKFSEKWGGYYTQDEIREIVQHAQRMHIEIIPEIDVPGHSRALAQLHPEILCPSAPDLSASNGKDVRNVLCASREQNYALLDDIFREVSALFPSPYIHIGGDEVKFEYWKACPCCQALKLKKGLRDEKQIEDYFISRVAKILARYGKKPAAWNEAINGGTLPRSTLIYGWQSVKACQESLSKGYPTILMHGDYLYFDQKQEPGEFGHTWAGLNDARKIIGMNLKSLGYTESQIKAVAGIQATFFSEIFVEHHPEDCKYLHYMLFPRMCALSEIAWGSSRRDWPAFRQALISHGYGMLSNLGIAFRLETPKVEYTDGVFRAQSDDGSILYKRSRSGEESLYNGPFSSQSVYDWTFVSRLGTGFSREIGARQYHEKYTPALRITTSMPIEKNSSLEKVSTYTSKIARTARAAKRGDWIRYEFEEPIAAYDVMIQTGHAHLRRCHFMEGHVEVEYSDGRREDMGKLFNGGLKIAGLSDVKSIWVICDTVSDVEPDVVILEPYIRKAGF